MTKGLKGKIRITIVSLFVIMVISSPVVVLSNPVLAYPSVTDTSGSHATLPMSEEYSPSMSSPATPTTQAALNGVWARQTNNIVGSQAYYDIVFVTSTTGTIKFIDITFPPGTLIGAPPRLLEREGIGAGNAVQASSTKISYTVISPVSILEGTKIRLEFFNIVNPTLPNTGYKVTVTTRTAGGTVIDGPTASNGFSMKQIGTGQIADSAVTTSKIADGAIQPQINQRAGDSVSVPPNSFNAGTANCLAGETAVSGGLAVFTGGQAFLTFTDTFPVGGGTGWRTEMFNSDPTNAHNFFPKVSCMPAMP